MFKYLEKRKRWRMALFCAYNIIERAFPVENGTATIGRKNDWITFSLDALAR